VFAIKQNIFVQSNTTHVHSINLIAIKYMLHVSAYT